MNTKIIYSFSALLCFIPTVSVLFELWFYRYVISNILYQPKFSLERANHQDRNVYIDRDKNSLKKFLFKTLNEYLNETTTPKTPLEFDNQKLAECKQYYSSFGYPLLLVSAYIPLTLIGIIFILCILIIFVSCLPKTEKSDFNMRELTNAEAKDTDLFTFKSSNIIAIFACGFLVLLLSIWGLCSPAYSILFRKGYNQFSNCTDSMPKDSMIYEDFSKLSDDFSYYSVLCGIGAFFVYFISAVIVILVNACNMVIYIFLIFYIYKVLASIKKTQYVKLHGVYFLF